MTRILPLLFLASCAVPPPPPSAPRKWILVSGPEGLAFVREPPPPVRVEARGPEVAPVGEVVEIEAWIIDPLPGETYVIEARPARAGVEVVGPSAAVVASERAIFRVVSRTEGRGHLVLEGRRCGAAP